MSDHSYVKVVSTLHSTHYRNRGITHNFHNMDETADFVDGLRYATLSGVKQIRIVPMEINFTDPISAARGLDGASGN